MAHTQGQRSSHSRCEFRRCRPANSVAIQKGTRVPLSLWDSLVFGRVPGTRPNVSKSHSERRTRVPFCIATRGAGKVVGTFNSYRRPSPRRRTGLRYTSMPSWPINRPVADLKFNTYLPGMLPGILPGMLLRIRLRVRCRLCVAPVWQSRHRIRLSKPNKNAGFAASNPPKTSLN